MQYVIEIHQKNGDLFLCKGTFNNYRVSTYIFDENIIKDIDTAYLWIREFKKIKPNVKYDICELKLNKIRR